MRIALYTETFLPKWDGVTDMLCRLLDHCHARGHDTLMFAPQGAPLWYEQTPVVGVLDFMFPLHPELQGVTPFLEGERRLADFRPDVVHLVNPGTVGLVGLRHARAIGAPVVVSYRADLPQHTAQWDGNSTRDAVWPYFRWIHDRVDLLLCPSHSIRLDLERWGFRNAQVWNSGVDTERFHPRCYSDPWRLRLSGGHPELPLLLWVGHTLSEKHIECFSRLLSLLPEVQLAIVGGRPLRTTAEKICVGRAAGDPRIVFVNCTGEDDLPRIYASADLVLMPMAGDVEEQPLLSAMASGTPIVAPRLNKALDHVVSGLNGFLFEPGNWNHMAALIRPIVSDPVGRRHLRTAARAHAESRSWNKVLDHLLGYYVAVIEEHTAARRFLPGLPPTPSIGSRGAYFHIRGQ